MYPDPCIPVSCSLSLLSAVVYPVPFHFCHLFPGIPSRCCLSCYLSFLSPVPCHACKLLYTLFPVIPSCCSLSFLSAVVYPVPCQLWFSWITWHDEMSQLFLSFETRKAPRLTLTSNIFTWRIFFSWSPQRKTTEQQARVIRDFSMDHHFNLSYYTYSILSIFFLKKSAYQL